MSVVAGVLSWRSMTRLWLIPVIALVSAVGVLLLLFGMEPEPFHATFESGSLADDKWQIDADAECRMKFSPESGGEPISLHIDAPEDARCELVPRIFPAYLDVVQREPFGEARMYRFRVFVEDVEGEPRSTDLGENTVIAQWHASSDPFIAEAAGRGPPLALRIQSGRWAITYGWDEQFRSTQSSVAGRWHWIGPVETGKWIEWEFTVRWSRHDDGLTEVRRNGQVVFQRSGPNAYNDIRGVYLKLGIYHPTSDMSIRLDEVTVTTAGAG